MQVSVAREWAEAGGGGGGSKILASVMSNLMLRFAVAVSDYSLLPGLGEERLLFVVRNSGCLPPRFLLKPLIGGVEVTPLCALWALLVCRVNFPAAGSCSLPLYIFTNVIRFSTEKVNAIKGKVFDTCIGILCKAAISQETQ